jgi:hypothetical protein
MVGTRSGLYIELMAMRIPLVLSLSLALIATPALGACQLDSSDLAALRLSPSGIQDQQAVDQLPADDQVRLCTTRDALKKLRKENNEFHGKVPPEYWVRYLAPDEKTLFVQAAKAWLFKDVVK